LAVEIIRCVGKKRGAIEFNHLSGLGASSNAYPAFLVPRNTGLRAFNPVGIVERKAAAAVRWIMIKIMRNGEEPKSQPGMDVD
jgi:hypothetical protein